jgi:putative transposase
MTLREIQGHLKDLYGAEVSPDLISRVTDAVPKEVREWHARPLDLVYPVMFFDALRVKIRDDGLARSKAVYAGPLDRTDRGCQVLAEGHERPEDTRRKRPVAIPRQVYGTLDCRGPASPLAGGGMIGTTLASSLSRRNLQMWRTSTAIITTLVIGKSQTPGLSGA